MLMKHGLVSCMLYSMLRNSNASRKSCLTIFFFFFFLSQQSSLLFFFFFFFFIYIGGVIFYTIILNIRGDVICSVMTEWDYFRTKCSGP
jgi:hypothetical protein